LIFKVVFGSQVYLFKKNVLMTDMSQENQIFKFDLLCKISYANNFDIL